MLARSKVPSVVMVSCNPVSFARDAVLFNNDGYCCDWLQVIEQFQLNNHIELVAQFSHI